jgi:hypothetical protein
MLAWNGFRMRDAEAEAYALNARVSTVMCNWRLRCGAGRGLVGLFTSRPGFC